MFYFKALHFVINFPIAKIRMEHTIHKMLFAFTFNNNYQSFHHSVGCPLIMLFVQSSPKE